MTHVSDIKLCTLILFWPKGRERKHEFKRRLAPLFYIVSEVVLSGSDSLRVASFRDGLLTVYVEGNNTIRLGSSIKVFFFLKKRRQ
jgi:hypothetical protein